MGQYLIQNRVSMLLAIVPLRLLDVRVQGLGFRG